VWSGAARSTGSPGVVWALLARLEGWALRGARGVVAVSEGVAARVRELARREVDVEVVRNGIDTEVFRPADDDPPVPGAPGTYFLYAGTASESQGADVFARALDSAREQHPETELDYLCSCSVMKGQRHRD